MCPAAARPLQAAMKYLDFGQIEKDLAEKLSDDDKVKNCSHFV